MKSGLEDKMRELIERESAAEAMKEWSTFFNNLDVPPFNYRFDHVEQSVNVAKQLAKETSADYDVVVMATWLHDCASPGTTGPPGSIHGEAGAKKAHEFLLKEGIDKKTVERVCDAIRKHGGYNLKKPIEPLEAQIVWEADKLTKMGIIKVIQQIILWIRYEPNMSMGGILEEVRKSCEIAREIAACMQTEPGKRIAKNRVKNVEDLIVRLESELT
ncbi:MAG: HD domain-containing protein [Promethearchaeota archaeon]|jgi:HD superfamily phosphodiesterase